MSKNNINKEDTAYIEDSLGQKYKLIQFFDHDEQKWLFALEHVPPLQDD